MAKIRSTEEVRVYWNTFAETYEKNFLKTTLQINSALLPHLSLHPSHTVAESGCGTGSGIELLLQQCPSLSKILANDISEVILQKAKDKNLPNTDFFLSSNENLPYESNSCDRYISNLSLQIVENPQNVLNEAFRVLKPSGIAVFSVPGKTEEFNFFCVLRRCLASAGVEPSQERSNFHLNDKENLNRMAREAGFVKVRSFFSTAPFFARNPEELVAETINITEAAKLKENDLEKYQRFYEIYYNEVCRIWESGNFMSFDYLVLVGEKGDS
jgi:ubiquinone/menaquinone biosynthesis C-methylase UbiE